MSKMIEGKPVQNAEKQVTLVITKDDVKFGDKKNPKSCAAAVACMRQLKATEARVHLSRTYVKIRGLWWRFQTPASLRGEIVAFDRGGSFEPGNYPLLLVPPSEIGRPHNPERDKKYGRQVPVRPRVPRHVTGGIRGSGMGHEI